MAPAAKESKYGMAGRITLTASTVNNPAAGSTTPDRNPSTNARPLLLPAAYSGMEMMAPSGKFWIAIPAARASAPPAVIIPEPDTYPAYTIPTAIPSGMLCSTTAMTIMVVLAIWLCIPSALLSFTCRCGMR